MTVAAVYDRRLFGAPRHGGVGAERRYRELSSLFSAIINRGLASLREIVSFTARAGRDARSAFGDFAGTRPARVEAAFGRARLIDRPCVKSSQFPESTRVWNGDIFIRPRIQLA
jgi:hypothetical protein